MERRWGSVGDRGSPAALRLALASLVAVISAGQGQFTLTTDTPPGACATFGGGSCFGTTGPRYSNSMRCSWVVGATTNLSVFTFRTESCCDYLEINGRRFAGTGGGAALNGYQVTAGTTIQFYSDSSTTQQGVQICSLGDTLPPTSPSPTAEPTTRVSQASNAYFSVTSTPNGACVLNGSCFGTSGVVYGNNERCTFRTAEQWLQLSATRFQTEVGDDTLTINGRQYSGANGPVNVTVPAGTSMRWTSDGSITTTGFRVCVVQVVQPPAPPPPSPYFRQTTDTPLGSCTISSNGSCFMTTGTRYGNNERCGWTTLVSLDLDFVRFATESTVDLVTVGGCEYSGTPGFWNDDDDSCGSNIVWPAGTAITWESDASFTQTGFTICAAPATPPTPASGSKKKSSGGTDVGTLIYIVYVVIFLTCLVGLPLVGRCVKQRREDKARRELQNFQKLHEMQEMQAEMETSPIPTSTEPGAAPLAAYNPADYAGPVLPAGHGYTVPAGTEAYSYSDPSTTTATQPAPYSPEAYAVGNPSYAPADPAQPYAYNPDSGAEQPPQGYSYSGEVQPPQPYTPQYGGYTPQSYGEGQYSPQPGYGVNAGQPSGASDA